MDDAREPGPDRHDEGDSDDRARAERPGNGDLGAAFLFGGLEDFSALFDSDEGDLDDDLDDGLDDGLDDDGLDDDGFDDDGFDDDLDDDHVGVSSDPGCNHIWQHLTIGAEAELRCVRCDRVWDLDEEPQAALLTVWNAAQLGFHQAQYRHDQLAAVVESMTGMVRCHLCERWTSPEETVAVGQRRACPEHLGLLLDDNAEIGDELDDARTWLQARADEGDVYGQWLLMRSALDCSELADEFEITRERIDAKPLHLTDAVAAKLGLTQTTTTGAVVERFSELLELDTPESFQATTVLLGVLARYEWASANLGTTSETVLSEVMEEAIPSHGLSRAMVVVDLYRDDIPDDGILTGQAVDDLVAALVSRAASRLNES